MATTVAELSVVVSADTSKAEGSLSSFSSKLGSVGGTMATAFGAAAIGGVVALAGGMVAATSAAAGFEAQMSAIKAVSGATGAEMEALQGKALQLGADTSFSASEAAAGIENLIKAGVSVADVLGGGAAAALSLAAAGGLSVADSAEIAANAMNVFSLKGADVGHVADVIAGAANASAIDVKDFGMSLAASGAVAATVGIGFDDLGTAIAVMGQAGIKGSDAGTSLKTMLLNLTPSSKAQIAVAKELGIVTADGANKFFDASGKAKSLSEVAGVLQTATAGLTEQQKLQALQTLFGTDAIRAAAVMAKAGSEGFDEMAASIGNVTAEAVAAERLNNLTGSIGQLGGSIETVAIKMGLQLTPIIRDVVDSLTAMVNGAGPLLENFAAMFSEGLAEGIQTGKDAFRQLSDAWGTVKQVFAGDWEPEEGIEEFALQVGLAAFEVKELADWLGKVSSAAGSMGAWDNFARGFSTLGKEIDLAGTSLGKIVSQLDSLTGAAGNTGTSINLIGGAVKIVGVAFELWALSMGQAIDTVTTFASTALSFIGVLGNVGRAWVALATGDIPTFEAAQKDAALSFVDLAVTANDFRTRTAERVAQGFQAISGSAQTEMPATAAAVDSGMSEASQAASAGFLEMASAADADLGAMAAAATGRFGELSAAAGVGTGEAVAAVDAGMAAVGPVVDAGMAVAVAGVQSGGEQMTASAAEGAAGAVAAVEGQTGAASGAGQSLGQALGSGLEGGIMAYVGRVASAAANLVSAAIGAANAEAEVRSPSKKTEQLGKNMADGLEIGLTKSGVGEAMIGQIKDFIRAAGDYVPVGREIARVEQEIKDIRDRAQTDSLFRSQDMITVESELLRLKRDQTDEERRLLPIRQDLAAAEREVNTISNGSLKDRETLLSYDSQRKALRLQTLDLEKALILAGKDEGRRKQLQEQVDKLRDQDRLLGIEADRIRTSRDLAADASRARVLGLGEILTSEEKNTTAIKDQITVLDAEKAVFMANEAIIKNATDNEVGYRMRLIAVFNAEGKPLADRMTAGLALVTQLEKEGKISKELADQLREVGKQAGVGTTATQGMGAAAAIAAPQIDAAAQKAKQMAEQAQAIANASKNASNDVLGLARSLGQLPSWFTPTGARPPGGGSQSVLFGASSTGPGSRDSSAILPGVSAGEGNTYITLDARGAQVYDGSQFEDMLVKALGQAHRGGRISQVTL